MTFYIDREVSAITVSLILDQVDTLTFYIDREVSVITISLILDQVWYVDILYRQRSERYDS